jgi:hypothetical protein
VGGTRHGAFKKIDSREMAERKTKMEREMVLAHRMDIGLKISDSAV